MTQVFIKGRQEVIAGGVDFGGILPPVGAVISFNPSKEELEKSPYKKHVIDDHLFLSNHTFRVTDVRIHYGNGLTCFNFRDNISTIITLEIIEYHAIY